MNILLSNVVGFCCLGTQRPSLIPMELFCNPDRHVLLTHPKTRNTQGHGMACGSQSKLQEWKTTRRKSVLKRVFKRIRELVLELLVTGCCGCKEIAKLKNKWGKWQKKSSLRDL